MDIDEALRDWLNDELPDFDDFVKKDDVDVSKLDELPEPDEILVRKDVDVEFLQGMVQECREMGTSFGEECLKDAIDSRISYAFQPHIGWKLEDISKLIDERARAIVAEREEAWRKEREALIAIRDLALSKTDSPKSLLRRIADRIAEVLL